MAVPDREPAAAPGLEPIAAEPGFLSHIPLAPAVEMDPAAALPFEPESVPAPPAEPTAASPDRRETAAPLDPPTGASEPPRRGPERSRTSVLGLVLGIVVLLSAGTAVGFYLGHRATSENGPVVSPTEPAASVVPAAPAVVTPKPTLKPDPAPKPTPAPKPNPTVEKPKPKPLVKARRRVQRKPSASHHRASVKPKREKPLTAAQKAALHRKQALELARRSEAILKKRAEKYNREHRIGGDASASTGG